MGSPEAGGDWKQRRVYVAGHQGMLGSAMLRILGKAGCDAIITRTRAELDLGDSRAVRVEFEKARPDVVFLCAGFTGGIEANRTRPAEFLHSNLAIQDAVFEASLACGAKSLVFFGSSCIYPREAVQPIPEGALFGGPIEPTSTPYALAKTAGIVGCQAYNAQYAATRFIALVPNSMYGPGDNYDLDSAHVLSALVRRFHEAKTKRAPSVILWGSGTPTREFIYVEDAAMASLFAVEVAHRLENRHYNIGTGFETRISDLAHRVASVVGYAGEISWDTSRPDGPARKVLNSDSFKALGWSPIVHLEDGLVRTYEAFLRRQA
jgi:GDP-L-fucose synthase